MLPARPSLAVRSAARAQCFAFCYRTVAITKVVYSLAALPAQFPGLCGVFFVYVCVLCFRCIYDFFFSSRVSHLKRPGPSLPYAVHVCVCVSAAQLVSTMDMFACLFVCLFVCGKDTLKPARARSPLCTSCCTVLLRRACECEVCLFVCLLVGGLSAHLANFAFVCELLVGACVSVVSCIHSCVSVICLMTCVLNAALALILS